MTSQDGVGGLKRQSRSLQQAGVVLRDCAGVWWRDCSMRRRQAALLRHATASLRRGVKGAASAVVERHVDGVGGSSGAGAAGRVGRARLHHLGNTPQFEKPLISHGLKSS